MGEVIKVSMMLECPGCGWVISNVERCVAQHDYPCGRCGRHKLSEFLIAETVAESEVKRK
jgi:hypothetical protein